MAYGSIFLFSYSLLDITSLFCSTLLGLRLVSATFLMLPPAPHLPQQVKKMLDYLPIKYFCDNDDDDIELEGSSKLAVLLTRNTSKQFKWVVWKRPLIWISVLPSIQSCGLFFSFLKKHLFVGNGTLQVYIFGWRPVKVPKGKLWMISSV